jgi:hypothetical protein
MAADRCSHTLVVSLRIIRLSRHQN